jgi:hypothetical protein
MKNPYSKGNSCLNCFSAICGPLPPSFLNLRAIVIQDDNINMTATGRININNTEQTIRYQPDENGRYNNYVIYIFELFKIRKLFLFILACKFNGSTSIFRSSTKSLSAM